MDEFAERLARLTELSADELAALEGELVAAFDAADQSGDVETMQQLADALDQVRAALAEASGGGEAPPEEAPPAEVAASGAEQGDEPTEGNGSEQAEGEGDDEQAQPDPASDPNNPNAQ